LHQLFGYFDGNGTVNGAAFGAAFGMPAGGSPFDFDLNGTLDGIDFAHFGNRFSITV
jgi:hypothetical protein